MRFNFADFIDYVALQIAIHPLWFGGVGIVSLLAIFLRAFGWSWPTRVIIRFSWRDEINQERQAEHARRAQVIPIRRLRSVDERPAA